MIKVTTAELRQHVLKVNWVSSMNTGGRKRKIAALVVVGDGAGKIGLGLGSSKESLLAIKKGFAKATKKMVSVPIRGGRTLYERVTQRFETSTVCMRPAPIGTGVLGSTLVRLMFDAIGIQDAVVKTMGTNNPHNITKAILKGLLSSRSLRNTASSRGISVRQVLGLSTESFENTNDTVSKNCNTQ